MPPVSEKLNNTGQIKKPVRKNGTGSVRSLTHTRLFRCVIASETVHVYDYANYVVRMNFLSLIKIIHKD